MFGLFKKKSKEEKLREKYDTLMKEWHKLSGIYRAGSDKKYAEAEKIMDQLEALQNKQS